MSVKLPLMCQAQTIYLCMGSACHQRRGYDLLPLLEALVCRHGLEGRVQLKGAFCLEACQQGRSLKFGNQVFTGVDEQTLGVIFEREILPHCRPD